MKVMASMAFIQWASSRVEKVSVLSSSAQSSKIQNAVPVGDEFIQGLIANGIQISMDGTRVGG